MRHLPPLSSLRTFEAVARLGSFRLAAEELNVTPTAVSHQITSLETHCGQTLFRRRPRPLNLTEAGEQLFPLIRDGLDLFAAAMEQIRERGRVARRLRVSTTNAFAARCLVPMLPIFHLENPDVELEVIGTDAVVDLRAGEADVALRYAREMPRDGVALELTRDRFHVVAAPSLLGPGGAKSWRRFPRIAYEWLPGDTKAPTWERLDTMTRTHPSAAGRIAMRFREELHAIEAVVAGQGVAICSDLLVRKELTEGLLVCVSPVTLEGYGLYLVTLPEQATAGTVKNFCAWMRRMFPPVAEFGREVGAGLLAAR
jgi:LysR family transcriptional regulator, glycine cleavage system transcriptional activator